MGRLDYKERYHRSEGGVIMDATFETKRRTIEDWLDQLIRRYKALKRSAVCPIRDIETITVWFGDIQIYKGIETIAFYLQETLIYNPNYHEGRGRVYFWYKGHEIFSLWTKEEE